MKALGQKTRARRRSAGKFPGARLATGRGMDTRDMTEILLRSENEIDNAIYAVLCAAFCADDEEELRHVVRLRLPNAPTPAQIVDAIVAELRWRGRLQFEEQRRQQAAFVLSAFLDLPASEREDVSLMAVV
jgi:hypothetical protein